jgi:hypothetical protein
VISIKPATDWDTPVARNPSAKEHEANQSAFELDRLYRAHQIDQAASLKITLAPQIRGSGKLSPLFDSIVRTGTCVAMQGRQT